MPWNLTVETIGYACNVATPENFATEPALSLPALVFFPGLGQTSLAIAINPTSVDAPTPISAADDDILNRDSDGEDFRCVVINIWISGNSYYPKQLRTVFDAIVAQASTWKIDITKIFMTGLSSGSIGTSGTAAIPITSGNYRDYRGLYHCSWGANRVTYPTEAVWGPAIWRDGKGTIMKGCYGENDPDVTKVVIQMGQMSDYANGIIQGQVPQPVLGADIITNGDFTTDLTGWLSKAGDSGTWAVVSNKASITTTTAAHDSDILYQAAIQELTQYDVTFFYTESAADIVGHLVSLDASNNIVETVVIPGGNTTSGNDTNTSKILQINSGAGATKIGFYFTTGAAGATMTIDDVIVTGPSKYRLWELPGLAHQTAAWGEFYGNMDDVNDDRGTCMYREVCDEEAPTVPTGLTTSNLAQNSFTVTWTPSTDASTFVSGYEIYLDGVLQATLRASVGYHPATTYNFTRLVPNTLYNITIKAIDFMDNISAPNANHGVTTLASPLALGRITNSIM